MKSKAALATAVCLGAMAAGLAAAPAFAQQLLAGERPAAVAAIPDVVAAGAQWQPVHSALAAADGMVGAPNGDLLWAEEQTDSVRKLDAAGHETIVITHANGVGALSMDTKGRIYGVERTCTDPGKPFARSCIELTNVAVLFPEHRVIANQFRDGRSLGRLNDLVADGKGGAYFTSGPGAYYAAPDGEVSVVADKDIRPNGIMLSPNGRVLYVSNDTSVAAFDVKADGQVGPRRDFGTLNGDKGGDGMAIDSAGRLYVTAETGVHVLGPDGRHLGVIPTPRRAISLAFAGPDKRTLFISSLGAVGLDGKPFTTPEGVRNTASTIHKLTMLAQGYKDRPK